MRKINLLCLAAGAVAAGILCHHAQAQSLSGVLGATHIDGQYYFDSNEDFLNEGTQQVVGLGSSVIKYEMNAGKYPDWNGNYPWPGYSSLTSLSQTSYFKQAFSNPSLSTYILTAYTPSIPGTSNADEYWLYGMTAAQEQAETQSFYNVTMYLLNEYKGTGKTFIFEQWEGDWALRDGPGNDGSHDGTITTEQTNGMIEWINARQAGIDEARAQFDAENPNPDVNVYGTLEVNRVEDAMKEQGIGSGYSSYTVTDDVLPYTNVDFASYSSYDTEYNTSGTYSYANAVQFLANHLPASAINGQNTQSVYVGEYGANATWPEGNPSSPISGTQPAGNVNSMIDNVINTVKADGMPYALYWEIYSNENANGVTPPTNGNNAGTDGFSMILPDGTASTAWLNYRNQIVNSDPTQSSTAAVVGGLHLAYASNFTRPGATLSGNWSTNTSGGSMSVGLTGGQVVMSTVSGSSTPIGQATLNLQSLLGRGLNPGEYVQFTMNRANDSGIIGVSAFGLNHGSAISSGNSPMQVDSVEGWEPFTLNPDITSNPSASNSPYSYWCYSYNWDTTSTLGLRLDEATGTSATVSYYLNGTYAGSWEYQTSATTLNAISLFAQSNTTGAAFDFNNVLVYTANGSLSATNYQWDPAHNGSGSGGSGTWDASSSANFFANSADNTWAYATLGDNAVFGGTAGIVSIPRSSGVTANTLIFNTAGYTISGGVLTLMGNQTIENNSSGTVTISSNIAGTDGVNITGSGNVALTGTNTFSGGLYIASGAAVTFSADGNLGAADQGVIINGGTLTYSGSVANGLTESTRIFTIGPAGATINNTSTSFNGKLIINGTDLIGGSGDITKTGAGWLTVYGDNTASFSGNWNINGGVVEAGDTNVLGTGTAIINNGGELALNIGSGSLANNVTLNTGGIIGTDNKTAGGATYSGNIAVNGNASVRLGDFYDNYSERVNFTGNLSGSGLLAMIGPGSAGTTNASNQIFTVSGNNAAFSGGFVIPTGTVAAGLSRYNTLGTGPITLSGGRLSLQGQQTQTGSAAAAAAIGATGYNADVVYGAPDSSSFSTATATMDGSFSYFQTGYQPQYNAVAGYAPYAMGTVLTNGIPGQSITSAIHSTPFTFQSFMANNALSIKEDSTGTLTLSTPGTFTTLSILAASVWGNDEKPSVVIHFTDGTSVTTSYDAFDWSMGTDATKLNADVFGTGGVYRYSPNTSPGDQSGGFGMYETDINMTDINGVDYSDKSVASLTFTATTYDARGRGLTDIFALTGSERNWTTSAAQNYSNNVELTSNSVIDVSGSLSASLGTLSIGSNQLSVTSGDTTANPYSLSFAATNLSGNATFDVAASSGGGTGTFSPGLIEGAGTITKTDVGTLQFNAPNNNITATLNLNGGTLEVDGNTNLSQLLSNGSGALDVIGSTFALTGQKGATIDLAALSISEDGTFDLGNGSLAISYTGQSPLSTILGYIASAYDHAIWNGPGLTSSAAQENGASTLGYVDTGSEVLVKYTWLGDLNLDGVVDSSDLAAFAPVGTTNATWSQGDLNYDHVINADDYSLFMLGVTASNGENISVTLPESISALPLATMVVVLRSRRRQEHPNLGADKAKRN